MNPLNFNCPFCVNCITDKDEKPICAPISRRISDIDTDRCELFTATSEGLKRQRWQITKLILILAGFIALLSTVIQNFR